MSYKPFLVNGNPVRVSFVIEGKTYTGDVIGELWFKTKYRIELDRINLTNGKRDWTNVDEVGVVQIIRKKECQIIEA